MTPYFVGKMYAISLPEVIYDFIAENIKGVRSPEQLGEEWIPSHNFDRPCELAEEEFKKGYCNETDGTEMRIETLYISQEVETQLKPNLQQGCASQEEYHQEPLISGKKINLRELRSTILLPKVNQTTIYG